MGRAHGPVHRVVEQDDAAVGGEYHQGDPRGVRDHGVHAGIVPVPEQALAAVLRRHMADIVLMDLLAQHRPVLIHPQGGAEPAVIFPDPVHVVPPAHAQVQGVPGGGADAADAGGEPVAHAGAVQQRAGHPQHIFACMGEKGHRILLVIPNP